MKSEALKDSLELCQEILMNRIDKTKVNVTLLKSKPIILKVICHVSFGKQFDDIDQKP